LTRGDLESAERLENARNTLRELTAIGSVIPIINENDTVANDEIRFGDNDTLAALVTGVVEADALIILSDVDAIYESDPTARNDALPIRIAYGDDPVLSQIAGPTSAISYGSGGMISKVRAGLTACRYGVPAVVAAGRAPDILGRILSGEEVGTLLVPRNTPAT
jgi:glutamate 5-kinase